MRPVDPTHPPRNRAVMTTGALALMALVGACSAADSGPKGIIPGAMALGKFCHELNRGGNPVTLTLQIGDPAITSISATTGICAPPAGSACASIPMGLVPVKLFEGDKLLTSRSVQLIPPTAANSPPNEYVFQAAVDSSTLQVVIIGGRISPGTCSGLDFPPPDGGLKDGGGDGAALEAGSAEAGSEAGPPVDAASADAGAPDVAAMVDAGADAATPDVAADTALAADVAADLATD